MAGPQRTESMWIEMDATESITMHTFWMQSITEGLNQ